MTINDQTLEKLLDKLYLRQNEAVNTQRQIDQFIGALTVIRRAPDGSLPIDRLTGATITEDRRNEIFEATIKNSIQFVGGED